MVSTTIKLALALAVVAQSVSAAPLAVRVTQDVSDATHEWTQACVKAGGGSSCKNLGLNAVNSLAETASVCAQQDAADAMVDFAKSLFNDQDMIRLAQIFVQQPRNTATNQSTPYCQDDPNNKELLGLYQCQFASASNTAFVGGAQPGERGTIPARLTAPLDPPGSCPAHPDGPIPDGEQLVHLTQDPGLDNVVLEPAVASTPGSSSEVSLTVPANGATLFCPDSSSKRTLRSKRRANFADKRAGQSTTGAVRPWLLACTRSGGSSEECSTVAVAAMNALLAGADACAQQDAADAMVAHAKAQDDAEMLRLARIYVQQPRNTPTSEAVPYCQRAPASAELAGLYQCQFQSTDQGNFVGGLKAGDAGTVPFGMTASLSPAGSCAASPKGPVPDGVQLVDLVKDACNA
ncbi:uncharacterized protein BXZ73DRAFT_102967 [Epithele typhae]|uniref:uncharacterized protein n=1 Tax=Epithele typhae TaxID=378194 RepID=UPI0020086E55|nr:uncharacterized protein BXZ73DRAFT_102967 [Epithele typhae]KAH9926285.1 hypothetical protein BXZ73DRAFT_102967 [Epithele typhae]